MLVNLHPYEIVTELFITVMIFVMSLQDRRHPVEKDLISHCSDGSRNPVGGGANPRGGAPM